MRNPLDHTVKAVENIVVSKPQYPQAERIQEFIFDLVVCHSVTGKVPTAINLDDQLRFWAIEIDDIVANRFLPVESHTKLP